MQYKPCYLQLKKEEFDEKIEAGKKHLTQCTLCPRECGVDRTKELGYCQAGVEVKVSSFGPHFEKKGSLSGEEAQEPFSLAIAISAAFTAKTTN